MTSAPLRSSAPVCPPDPRYAAEQKPPRHPLITQHGQRRHTPLPGKVAAVAGKQFLCRRRRRLLRRQDLPIPQIGEQRGQRLHRRHPPLPRSPQGREELPSPGHCQVSSAKALGSQPAVQLAHHLQLAPHRSAARNRTAPVHADNQPHTRPAGPRPRPTKPCPSRPPFPEHCAPARQGSQLPPPGQAGLSRPGPPLHGHAPARHRGIHHIGRTSSRDNPRIGISRPR